MLAGIERCLEENLADSRRGHANQSVIAFARNVFLGVTWRARARECANTGVAINIINICINARILY